MSQEAEQYCWDTYMHERPPPRKVILSLKDNHASTTTPDITKEYDTHRLEYTPGICAWVTVSGRGESHRSGFHSSASDPHIAGLQFAARMPTVISVPLGTKISFNKDPSVALMGDESGIIMSFRVLRWK